MEHCKSQISKIREDCLKKEENYEKRLEDYIKSLKTNKSKALLNPNPTQKPSQFLQKYLKEPIFLQKKSLSTMTNSKNLSELNLNPAEINLNSLTERKPSQEKLSTKSLHFAQTPDFKHAINKLNGSVVMWGLSKKRSKTIRIRALDEFENYMDSRRNCNEPNFSLSKKTESDMGEPDIADPYGLISILSPKFRKSIENTKERYKLMRKKGKK